MKVRMYVVNAFTKPSSRRFLTGNPAGVALLSESENAELKEEDRQELATEINLSETAYVTRVKSAEAGTHFEIRWFTPKVEVDLCGHATLAAARAAREEGWWQGETIEFRTRNAGTLSVTAGTDELIMEFPALEKREALSTADAQTLGDGLGVAVIESFQSDYDIIARVADRRTVEACQPQLDILSTLDTRGIIVTAGAEGNVRFVSRFFAPRVGIMEDAVTGSAHCALAPLFLREGESNVQALQLSSRGGWLRVGRPRRGRVSIAGRSRVVWGGTAFL